MASPKVDATKIKKAVEAEIPLSITTYTLPHEMELYQAEVLNAFLKELKQESLSEYLVYCLNELTTNAKKANTKRVYFKQKNLNINNVDDYEVGMQTFKSETLNNINYYLKLQQEQKLYIKIIFQHINNCIKIEIRNNSPITFFEYKRVHDKLARSQRYAAIDEAFSEVLDDTEGAGLGIVIMMLMLKKIGLNNDMIHFFCENEETIARICLPLNDNSRADMSLLSKEIVNNIESLPEFPDTVFQVNRMLNDPEFKLSEVVRTISTDVTLTADLLKLANSAAFSLSKECTTIADAVKFIGVRGVKNLLFSVGTMNTIGTETVAQKKLWEHCHKVAFYSYNLARNFFSKQKGLVEDSYVCGLLHDMGKGVFLSAQPEFMKKLDHISDQKAIPAHVLERLISGQNHAEIGALIAEKWNFPEVIVDTIRNHHNPSASKPLSIVVYLANMIANYQAEIIEYYQFDQKVLDLIHIKNEEQLQQISEKLKLAFDSE